MFGITPYASMGNSPMTNVDPAGDIFVAGAIIGFGVGAGLTALSLRNSDMSNGEKAGLTLLGGIAGGLLGGYGFGPSGFVSGLFKGGIGGAAASSGAGKVGVSSSALAAVQSSAVSTVGSGVGILSQALPGLQTVSNAVRPLPQLTNHLAQVTNRPTLILHGVNTLSNNGLHHISQHEGLRLNLYNDAAGHATIGYGHLVHYGPINGTEPAMFTDGITQAQALDLLRQDAQTAVNAVNRMVTQRLTQNEFDALTSFVFNVGAGNFQNSTLLRQINRGNFDQRMIQQQFARWNRAGGRVLQGLVRRRAAEANLFLTP